MYQEFGPLFVLFVILMVAVWAIIPIWIAKSRNHANFNGVILLTILGWLIFPLWLVAICWAVIGQTKPSTPKLVKRRYVPQINPNDYPVEAESSDPLEELAQASRDRQRHRY